jgi:hypothetical protein
MGGLSPADGEEWIAWVNKNLAATDRRGKALPSRGPASLRDIVYGHPNDFFNADRRALAGTYWYDTDLGLMFRYYARVLDEGAPGATAGPSAGWYPCDPRPPRVFMEKTAAQSLGSAGSVMITWRASDTANYDPFGMYDSAVSTEYVTLPWTGLWRVKAKIRITGTAAMTGVIARSGSDYNRSRTADVGASGAATTLRFDDLVYATAGQVLGVKVTSTAAVTFISTNGETWFEATYEGPPPN